MRLLLLSASILPLVLTLLTAGARAEDKDAKNKINSDKAKEILDKLVGEAKKAAGKMQEGGDKGNALWSRSKETLALPQNEYLKRAESAMRTMDTEIKALAEAEGAVSARDYFKTHVESLKQQLAYCKQDEDKLKSVESEETFRVKQKKFDRTLGFLADNIQLAKDEAGL